MNHEPPLTPIKVIILSSVSLSAFKEMFSTSILFVGFIYISLEQSYVSQLNKLRLLYSISFLRYFFALQPKVREKICYIIVQMNEFFFQHCSQALSKQYHVLLTIISFCFVSKHLRIDIFIDATRNA